MVCRCHGGQPLVRDHKPMVSLKSYTGRSSGAYEEQVTADRISTFCKAIGAQDRLEAPPTFLTVFRKGEFDLFRQIGVDLAKILHADQEYQYEGPIHAGDTIRFETRLTQVLEKQTSVYQMQFLTFETEFHVQKEQELRKVGSSKTTIVIRNSAQST